MKQRIEPGAGQESVWDYPRPPRLEPFTGQVRVVHAGRTLADTTGAFRVLETSHPPVFYIPAADVQMDWLMPSEGPSTFCEWKGRAMYWDLCLPGEKIARVAWSYPDPSQRYADLRDHLAFYPGKVDACFVDGEQVQSQPGDFYGGWITSKIVGPFKGGPGTWGW